jgi:hypothetical protein
MKMENKLIKILKFLVKFTIMMMENTIANIKSTTKEKLMLMCILKMTKEKWFHSEEVHTQPPSSQV